MPSIEGAGSPFAIAPALTLWIDAMDAQTTHEADCPPCLLNGVPMCAEGSRLQVTARQAHEDWVSERWGYVIEPWARRLG